MNNNLDNIIRTALKKDVDEPLEYEYAIKNAFIKNQNIMKKNIFYRIALIASYLIMGSTCVMAVGYIAYEKIWREPITISQNVEEEIVKTEITDEEKQTFITEERAVEIAKGIIKDLGYGERNITEVRLNRGYDEDYSCHYLLKSDELLINLNPENGSLEYFGDTSVLEKGIICDEVSEEYISEIANGIYQKLGIIQANSANEYEIVSAQKQKMISGDKINELWQVSYGKVFNGLYDKNNIFTICLAINKGNIVISSITGINDNTFENNPIVVSKEEAIKIALDKEKEFSNLEVSSVNANLSIEKMNIFVYCLENDIENKDGEYRVNDISRNVWVVEIKHDKDAKPKDGNIETVKELYNKKYYIDATTGEIIGGEQAEF